MEHLRQSSVWTFNVRLLNDLRSTVVSAYHVLWYIIEVVVNGLYIPYRLKKYWLKGEKAGTSEVMAVVPGYPDNIRTNERGEFWVAIHARRSVYSYISGLYPNLRKFLLKLPIPVRIHYLLYIGGRLHGTIVKYSPEGKVLQVLEDRQGKVVKAVSEVEEKDGKLWIGSVLMPFIAVYELDWSPINGTF